MLDLALANLPATAQPGRPDGPRLVARSDSAGATHGFAAACRDRHVGFSFGFAVTEAVRHAIAAVPEAAWRPAVETDGDERHGAWVAELTGHLDLSAWPTGSRVIARRERPRPGAALSLFDTIEGLRHTARSRSTSFPSAWSRPGPLITVRSQTWWRGWSVPMTAPCSAGAELVSRSDWHGLRSHPMPTATISFGGPEIPPWMDDALREAVSPLAR